MLNSVGKYSRFLFRAIWFAAELLLFFAAFLGLLLRYSGKPTQAARSRWLQWCSRRTLRVFAVPTNSTGPPPQAGLLVSNHLSYLDILVLVSLTPAVFVSKSEVKNWPVFGWFASLAGTLFVDRTRRSDVTRMNALIENSLAAGNVVVLFPEGTSWNGNEVLPFKSSLLEPVVGTRHPISVGFLQYSLADGDPANDVCYWADMTFFPHLVKLMTKREIQAQVRFAAVPQPATDRKQLATQLHAAVVQLSQRPTE
ncbi:MAG: 1-acyl-sn-glycerol-3-phosphate acyltransferase [Verrucomicrobiota bacterium]